MSIRSFKSVVPQVHARAWVDAQAAVIGDVWLAEEVSVWPCAVIRGDVAPIRIGARSNIQDGAVIHATHNSIYTPGGRGTVLGCDVTVGHGAILHACTIGDNALIGMHATVLDGAEIGAYTLIAAGTLVPPGKKLEGGYLYMGNPARRVRALDEKERAFFAYSAAHYIQLADAYRDHAR